MEQMKNWTILPARNIGYVVAKQALRGILLWMLCCAWGGLGAQGTRRDTTICEGDCVQLITTHIVTQTDTYLVQSIPFAPPVSFQAGNLLNGLPDDQWSNVISIGFDFHFYCSTFSKLVIASNGNVTFNTLRANQFSHWQIAKAIPDSNSLDNGNCIMAPFQDIDPSVNNRTPAYGMIGTAPYRKFFVNWDSIPLFSCNSKYIRSQLILHETTNRVEIYLEHKDTCNGWNFGASILGMQDGAGVRAAVVPGRNYPTKWIANQEAWAFVPVSPNSSTVQWSSGGQNIATGDSVTVCPATMTSYVGLSKGLDCTGDSLITTDTLVVHLYPPLVPAPIMGPNAITPSQAGVGYGIPIVASASGYGWTVQGGTFVGPSNWRNVVVDWGSTGPYSVCVWPIDIHQCNGDTVCLSVLVGTGAPSALQNIQLSPNPATTQLRLQGDFAGKLVTLQVVDLLGSIVQVTHELATGDELQIALDGRDGGYYFLRVELDGAVRLFPFVHLK